MTHEDDTVLHESTIDALINRLQKGGRYTTIKRHYEYHKNTLWGEADVVAISPESIHYYEVKCRDHPNSYSRAVHQFVRFSAVCDMHPVKYIYVTPTSVRRVRL